MSRITSGICATGMNSPPRKDSSTMARLTNCMAFSLGTR
jgi:hypothetical protein